jgi:O-antigen/teichoic acid export membrane protein
VLGFATGIIVARALGPAGRGEYSIVTSCALILVMLALAGMPSALVQARAKAGRSLEDLYSASIVIGIAGAVLAVGLGAGFYLLGGSRILRVARPADLAWVVVVTPPLLILNHWTVVAYLEDRIKEFGLVSLSGGVFFVAAIGLAKLTGQLTPSTAIALWVAATTLPLLLMLRRRRLRFGSGLRDVTRGLLQFSLRSNVFTLGLVLVWRIDVVIVDWQRGLGELGLYSVAVALAEILMQFAVSARIALTPMQGSPHGRDELVGRICRINRVMLAALASGGLVMALGSGIVVRLAYGPAFGASAAALVWLLPGVIALLLQGPVLDYLVTEGRVRDVTAVCLLALIVNVGIDLLFLPHNSFVVAAIASTVAYMLSCGLCMLLFLRLTGVGVVELMVVQRSDIDAVRALSRGLLWWR